MSCTNDDVDTRESDQADEPAWWQEVLRLGDGEASADPLPEADWAAFFTSDVPTADAGEFAGVGQVAGPETGAGDPVRQGQSSRQRQIYTPEKLDEIRTRLLALPTRDPAERRLDKQTAIRHIVEEITALQQRGYTLEQVAALLTDEGIEVTTPTL